jgi:heat shock protein HslJ
VSRDSQPVPAADTASTSATSTPTANVSGSWLWVETIKGEETVIPRDAGAFSVTFSEGSLTGTTDCNNFSGTFTVSENTIAIGAVAMSKKFCEDSQEMEFTQQFIGNLTVSQVGDALTLTHSDGTISRYIAK